MHTIALGIIYFFIYAFLGWLHELIYFLVKEHHFKTTSFLRLPLLPIYGLGAMAILGFISPYVANPFLVFVLSVAAATVLEYASHWLIDTLFHIQLWNYDTKKFNLHGRIALENSLGFGILALLLVYVIHPCVSYLVIQLPDMAANVTALIFMILIVLDFANQVGSLTGLRFSKIAGTLADIQANLVHRLASIALPGPVKVRLRRSRSVILKVHQANLRRLRKAFPEARMRRGH